MATELIVNQNDIHQAIWDWIFEGDNGISELSFITASYDQDGNILNDSKVVYTPETIGKSELVKEDIKGNKQFLYTFIIKQYAPLSNTSNTPVNIKVLGVFENLVNWVKLQHVNGSYPVFPDNCVINSIIINSGTIAGVDSNGAEFNIILQIDYKEFI